MLIGKAPVARTWAVEKRLRNLVNVPSPVRSDQTTGVSTTGGQLISSAPSAVGNLDGVTQEASRSSKRLPVDSLPAVKVLVPSRIKPSSGSTQDDALLSLTSGNAKLDSPHQPARTHPEGLISTKPAAQPNSSSRFLSSTKHTETEPKSASLLKLVGGGSDRLGKSKEELVDEYKRARRAELEAMLRTMVNK